MRRPVRQTVLYERKVACQRRKAGDFSPWHWACVKSKWKLGNQPRNSLLSIMVFPSIPRQRLQQTWYNCEKQSANECGHSILWYRLNNPFAGWIEQTATAHYCTSIKSSLMRQRRRGHRKIRALWNTALRSRRGPKHAAVVTAPSGARRFERSPF